MQKIFSKSIKSMQTALLAALVFAGASNAQTVTEFGIPLAYAQKQQSATKLLDTYDVVLLVDSSKSMGYSCSEAHNAFNEIVGGDQSNDVASSMAEFLGNIGFNTQDVNSRWEWCRARAGELASTGNMSENGLRLIIFGDKAAVHEGVNGESIDQIFATEKPHGGTFAARSLETEFSNYFKRREQNAASTKPLLVAIITDGSFGDKWSSRRAIIKATQKMTNKDEILVAILKIGDDPKAPQFLDEIDNQMMTKYHAKYDIVEVTPFDKLNDLGMAGVLANVVNEKRQLTQAETTIKSSL